MNTKDRKENQFVLIEFSEEQQAFNFNLDGADKTAPSYMPIVWLPHLDAARWTQEMKNLRADHRLTLEEVVERSMTPLVKRGTIKLECVRHMHKIHRDEVDGLPDEYLRRQMGSDKAGIIRTGLRSISNVDRTKKQKPSDWMD